LFPIVWARAPTGFEIIAIDLEVILYLDLDIITKIFFEIYLIMKHY
jgi:bacteriorhodopsin